MLEATAQNILESLTSHVSLISGAFLLMREILNEDKLFYWSNCFLHNFDKYSQLWSRLCYSVP